jgi:hypothetical protein
LLIFAAVIEQGSAIFDHPGKDPVHGFLSQRRIFVKVADELAAQCTHVVDVFLDRLR